MRIVLAILVLLFLVLQYGIWLGDFGYIRLNQLNDAVVEQGRENADLERRNQRLEGEVVDLKQGTAALEERARSQLGMIKEDETFYQVLKPQE